MVVKFVAWLHLAVFRLAAWLIGWTLKGLGKWALVLLALLGEEFRRYAGLVLSGTVIVVMGKLILALPDMPGKRWALLVVLGMLAVWAGALRRAARHTRHNSLLRTRNRQAMKGMAADIATVRGKVTDGLAKRAKGTPLEGAWSSNRSAREEERAAAERAASQAEADRAAAAERDRRDRVSREERERELEMMAAEHNPFE